MRRLLWVSAALLLLLAAGAGVGYLEILSRLSPVSSESKKVIVSIPRGTPVREIGRILEQSGVIRSGDMFYYYVLYKKAGRELKAGEHLLDAGLSTPEVAASLVQGRYKLYRLTVPEGLTMVQTADLAAQSGLADRETFLALCRDRAFIASLGLEEDSLEGYLFPETYHFVRETTAPEVIQAMVGRFLAVWDKYKAQAEAGPLSRREVVTLASIVEKETGAPEERPLIAAVFLNRLKRGMRLETDPTVIYGIKDFDGNLTRKHLETYTQYNTYQIDGLPPGPIANPGEASLAAVLAPTPTEALFFVSRNDGTHYFSRTLAEHNRAVNRYQRRR